MAYKAAYYLAALARNYKGPVKLGVFLAGYSRGAAGVIEAAWRLKADGVQVHCLLLYDAVDRSATISKTTIPSNVLYCYHAIRDPATYSRSLFGNCGRKATSSTTYVEKMFFCTHGGMGGLPWTTSNASGSIKEKHDISMPFSGHSGATNVTPAVDRLVSAKVEQWMNNNFNLAIRAWASTAMR